LPAEVEGCPSFWCLVQEKAKSFSCSLNSGATRATSFKKAKDRVTILGCSNASGSYGLPLVLINKSAKPRCFKHGHEKFTSAILFTEKIMDGQ